MYVPAELGMFVELFRKRIEEWELLEEADIYPLGDTLLGTRLQAAAPGHG